jgi:hypothetical protein
VFGALGQFSGLFQLAILALCEIRVIVRVTRTQYYKNPWMNRLVVGASHVRLLILIILTPIVKEFNAT